MYGVSKAFSLAIISLSAAVVIVVIFAWQAPGLDNVTPSASAALFDEQLSQLRARLRFELAGPFEDPHLHVTRPAIDPFRNAYLARQRQEEIAPRL